MTTDPDASSDTPEPRKSRRVRRADRAQAGRRMIAGLWCLLRLGDLPLAWLAFRAIDPAPQLRTNTIVAILWTTVLLIALWKKQRWARYVALILLGCFAALYGFTISIIIVSVARGEAVIIGERIFAIGMAAACYLIACVMLLRSRSIKRLIDPTEGWKPQGATLG